MSGRNSVLTALLGTLTVLLFSPQLLSQGIAYGHALPVYHPPHVPLPYLQLTPVPAVRLGFPYDAHAFPYMLGYPWIVPHVGYPIVLGIPAKANADSEGNANGIPGRRRTVFGA